MEKEEMLGIDDYDFNYYELQDNQDFLEEIVKSINFMNIDFIKYLKNNYPNYYSKNINIRFINYGHMEIVYVLDNGNKKYTLLMGQPNLEFGKVKCEYDNLKILSKNNEGVVKPILYYTNNKREVYMTPYYYQARCISYLNGKLGVYVPEPSYHFEDFGKKEKDMVETAIAAKIISSYNFNTNTALMNFDVNSGDFILQKRYKENKNSASDIFEDMKLIAARRLDNITLDDYIDLIYEKLEQFDSKNIDNGIDLGYSITKKRK